MQLFVSTEFSGRIGLQEAEPLNQLLQAGAPKEVLRSLVSATDTCYIYFSGPVCVPAVIPRKLVRFRESGTHRGLGTLAEASRSQQGQDSGYPHTHHERQPSLGGTQASCSLSQAPVVPL